MCNPNLFAYCLRLFPAPTLLCPLQAVDKGRNTKRAHVPMCRPKFRDKLLKCDPVHTRSSTRVKSSRTLRTYSQH